MQYCLNWGPIHVQFGTDLACKHLFKCPNPPSTLPTSSKTITRVKMSTVKTSKGALWEGFTLSTCLLDSMHTKLNDWRKCWSKLSQLTNHRAHHAIPKWGIENNAYRLHYSISPQPPHGSCATFFDPFSLLSWSWEQAFCTVTPACKQLM